MTSRRQKRVAEQLHHILSTLIEFEVEDPRLSTLTVTDVTIDRELMYATVYVSALEGDAVKDVVMRALERASGFLRRELGAQIRLQHVPELRFRWDETEAQAARIDELLNALDIPPADAPESDDADVLP